MGEFLKSECPHCGQAIEYPQEGTGQTVPCPTCEEPFILQPFVTLAPEILPPQPAASTPVPTAALPPVPPQPIPITTVVAPPVPPAPAASEPKPSGHANHGSKHSSHSHAGRLDQACREFASDQEFEKLQPKREQIARALAAAKFRQTSESEWPTHAELVAALKELFPEFRKRAASTKTVAPGKK